MYRETREPHDPACECEYCIADRRFESTRALTERILATAEAQNKVLAAIADELRALRMGVR